MTSRRNDAHLAQEAAAWLARRDRGLRPAEAHAFAAWLSEPGHAAALRELEGPFAALDRVAALRTPGERMDPDVLVATPRGASRRSRPVRLIAWTGLAAAALAVLVALPFERAATSMDVPAADRGVVVRHEPERRTLPDGSQVELRAGTQLEVVFTSTERRIELRGGAAFFAVEKEPARPFVVRVDGVTVRAVGTAFLVQARAEAVEVLVTEGRVRVDDPAGNGLLSPTAAAESPTRRETLDAGERVVLDREMATPAPVTPATPAVVEQATAWRHLWLEFGEMPLGTVVREFNRHQAAGGKPLRVADDATGRVRVSGTFRADGVEAFVRLLESSFGLSADRAVDGTVTLRLGR